MILGVNGIRLVRDRSGVARCIEAILRCLGEMDHPFEEIRVYTPAPLAAGIVLPPCARNVVLPSPLSPALWEQWVLPRAHGRQGVLLCPSYVLPLLARCPTFLIHHGSYEGYPQAFDWWTLNKARLAYSASARRATVVSTVSEYSKRDMVKFYGLDPETIHVVPEGVDTALFRPLEDQSKLRQWRLEAFGCDTPYIAYVGKPTERRNLSPLIHAFAALKREHAIPHKFVIVGADLPGTSPFRQVITEENMHNEIVVRGYAGHDEMPLVYGAADLFVYPSSYEGFGMPVLEAMAAGVPVLTSNRSALPEVAGEAALLVDPEDTEALMISLRNLTVNEELRSRLTQLGLQRAQEFTWNAAVQRTWNVYRDVLNGSRRPPRS
jgi:glycosyltransferase involved in cell wall biosynthesis